MADLKPGDICLHPFYGRIRILELTRAFGKINARITLVDQANKTALVPLSTLQRERKVIP